MAAPVATPITAKATASHHTGTDDSPWDAGRARRGYPNEAATLKAVHAWVDSSGDPDAKSSYKFPHHYKKGGPANLAGCRNGLSRLPGADVDDKDGVKRHLQAHLDDQPGGDGDSEDRVLRLARPVARLRQGRTGWYRIANKAGGTAEVYIYDEIGYFGTTAKGFVDELRQVKAARIDLHLNSPGGDAFDGIAIYQALLDHKATVTTHVDALAASAASFIAMAGEQIVIARNATMMIHDAFGLAVGNAGDMRDLAERLDKVADIYAQRAGGTVADWREAMRAETWYDAEEAVEAGLADEVKARTPAEDDEEESPAAADDSFDLSVFTYAGRDHAPAPQLRPAARAAGPAPAAAEQTSGDGDVFAEVDDEQMASLGETLADLFDPTGGYDPQVLGALIGDVYADAPAPPTLPPPPERPRTVIPIEELIQGIQEGVRP
jgi:ATP-dependent protease ClpP protease subunit